MSHTDPYSPPQSSLGGLTSELPYSRFWDRVGAALIDFLIMLPVVGIDYLFGSESRFFQLYMLVPVQVLTVFLQIYMVVKYGGTPGKLLVGLRIAKLDGAPVTVKEAVLRYSVVWVMGLAIVAVTIMAAMGMSDADYSSLSYMERSVAISQRAPLIGWISGLMQVWIWGNIITVLANTKRRALHDFIAGTVVLRR